MISSLFVSPVLQERQEKTYVPLDTNEIFQKIEKEANYLDYEKAVNILNDLAFIVIPFDKTHHEFQLLISRLKLLLQNQSHNVKLFKLIEAVNRLSIDSFNDLIRRKIDEGNYSRASQDICAAMFFLGSQFRIHGSNKDAELFEKVVYNLEFMQTANLKIEHLIYLIKALRLSSEPVFLSHYKNKDATLNQIENFIPKIIHQTQVELFRCNISDIVTIMDSLFKLWNKNIFKSLQMTTIYKTCESYLQEFLGRSKKDITGSQFASLIEQIGVAHQHKLHEFDSKLIHIMQHIFVNDHSDLYVFGIDDLHKIFIAFETLD